MRRITAGRAYLQPSALACVLLVVVTLSHMEQVDGFGLLGRTTSIILGAMSDPMTDFAEAVNGDVYAGALWDDHPEDATNAVLGDTDELLVSVVPSLSRTQQPDCDVSKTFVLIHDDENGDFSSSESVSPISPPLTFSKFLTMQSKRVPVAIRYSADAGMKPYFLTVAKKLKDAHPDIILDKVILPKVEMGDGKMEASRPTFEVMVDGRVVIPTVGKKDRDGMGSIIFVSMQELDFAISRARRRRRPSTVYGEGESNVRLEMLKAKAAAMSQRPPERNSQKNSND